MMIPAVLAVAVALDPGAAFDPEIPAALEVVKTSTGHLLVQPTINGHEAGWFIFDTGAGICVVSTKFVEELELKPAGQTTAVGFGAETADLFTAATLTLGPATFKDHTVMETDLSFLRAHLGREIAGVIGFGVLSHCVAEIDLVTPGVALHDPATFELSGAAWQPVELSKRIPVVQAKFEDREGTFTIDTGSNGMVSFHDSAVEKWKLLDGRDVSDSKLGGVGGFIQAKKGVVDWFELGGVRQERVAATFEVETKGTDDSRIDGNIGAELLRPFTLVTDYTNNRIAFRPRAVEVEEDEQGEG